MSLEKQILFKNELQTSETCAILDMSRQNLYKMRKEGRMYRLIESQDSKFYKDSVYQEWFQRHIKALNMQLPLTSMKDMVTLMIHLDDKKHECLFNRQTFAPMINVLLSNYGTTQTPVKIPYEYTMRFYHIISSYLLEIIANFKDETLHNSRIESEINAFIQSLYQQVSYESAFKTYIEALKQHCYRCNNNDTLIHAFIEATDVYAEQTICQDYVDKYVQYYDVFRESLIMTLFNLLEYVLTDVFVYHHDEKFQSHFTIVNLYSQARRDMRVFVNQILALLYDARSVLVS